jgi:hypothetical protein
MAVVKANYTRSRKGAKANIRYIMHRPGRDGSKVTRSLFGRDAAVSRREAYETIDTAPKGSVFFRLKISPDPKTEDTKRDLPLREITERTMSTVEERVRKPVAWIGAIHADHTPIRHVHVLAVVQGRINTTDLQALREAATTACQEQRRQRDHVRALQQQREEEQWERQR